MNNLNCQSQMSEKMVQHCAPSPPRGGVSRPVMAHNRVFLSSIDDIRKDQDRSRNKKTLPSSESEPQMRVEHAENIKVKVQVETNNNDTPVDEDCMHLQDREEPSGAEGDDECEDLADSKEKAVENHENIQVQVFTQLEPSPASFSHDNQIPPNQDENVLNDSDLELRKKAKKKKCRRKSSSHSRTRDRSKSPSKSRRTPSPRRDLSVSPSKRHSRRSGCSKTSLRDQSESPRREAKRHHKSRERSRTRLSRDNSNSPRRDARRHHKSRDSSETPQSSSSEKRKHHTSMEEENAINFSFQQEKFVETKSNKPNISLLNQGLETTDMLSSQSISMKVADIPLPPLDKTSFQQYVTEIVSSEDEMVDYMEQKISTTCSSSKTSTSSKIESYASVVKKTAPDHTLQLTGQPQGFSFNTSAVNYYNSPPASSMYSQPPPAYYYPQTYSTPPPMCRGVFQWSTTSNIIPYSLTQSPISSHQQEPSLAPTYQSPCLVQLPTSTPPAEVDKKFQCLQNLHSPPRPNFRGYQLLGDSMLLRFSQQILGDNAILAESLRFLGYCVSGQRIGDLLKRLRSGFYHLGKRVVVMIGTNDLLRSTPARQMCNELSRIVDHLKAAETEEIIILTLPPVPRLQNQTYHWQRLQEYNEFIKTLADKERGISIFNISPFYILSQEELEEEELLAEFKTDTPFCNGCFTCIEESADDSWNISSESDEDDLADTAMLTRVIINTCRSHIKPVDVCKLFVDHRISRCRLECFELTFSSNGGKDLIHLNNKGLNFVKDQLDKVL